MHCPVRYVCNLIGRFALVDETDKDLISNRVPSSDASELLRLVELLNYPKNRCEIPP